MSARIETSIAKYSSWLNRQPVDRPMLGVLWEPDIPPLPEMLDLVGIGTQIGPQDILPDMYLPYIENWFHQEARIKSDVIQPFTPAFGIPWVEAIAGCPVVAHPGSLWAAPTPFDYETRPEFALDFKNPWLQKLLEFTRVLQKFSHGRFPIALPQMRGPLDTLAALRTPGQLCLDIVDQPDEVFRALGELTELWIGIADAILELIPPYRGGYCTRMKMWAPGKAITPQNDSSTLFSPVMYKKMVFPWDQKIFDAFPYHSFHMHSTEYRHIPTLLDSPNLAAIQLTLEQDIGGPPLDVMLEAAKQILQKKPLLLAALDTHTADVCLQSLPSIGLCLMVATSEPEIPADIVDWLEDRVY